MANEDDVERLFSWLKTPELHYREFADAREMADAVAPWPIVQAGVDTTAGETVEPDTRRSHPIEHPEHPLPDFVAPVQPPLRASDPGPAYGRPGAAPSPLPSGERLMSALGRRVRAARFGPEARPQPAQPVYVEDDRVAQQLRAARQAEADAAAARAAAAERAAQLAAAGERARAEAMARAEAEAEAQRLRVAAEAAAAAHAEAEAQRRRAEAEAAAAARYAAEEAAARRQAEAAAEAAADRPALAAPADAGERAGLFGRSHRQHRDVREPASAPRQGRPLDAVFSRLSRHGDRPSGHTPPASGPALNRLR